MPNHRDRVFRYNKVLDLEELIHIHADHVSTIQIKSINEIYFHQNVLNNFSNTMVIPVVRVLQQWDDFLWMNRSQSIPEEFEELFHT